MPPEEETSIFREERSLGGRSIDLDLNSERFRFAGAFIMASIENPVFTQTLSKSVSICG